MPHSEKVISLIPDIQFSLPIRTYRNGKPIQRAKVVGTDNSAVFIRPDPSEDDENPQKVFANEDLLDYISLLNTELYVNENGIVTAMSLPEENIDFSDKEDKTDHKEDVSAN